MKAEKLSAEPSRIEDLDPPEFHLAVVNMKIREMMNFTLRPHGIKLVEWRLLQVLTQQSNLSICDLSQLAVIERTVTSRLVDKLVDRGLIRKSPLPSDRRFSQVSLTAKGEKLLKQVDQDVTTARARLFEGISQEDLVFLNQIIRQMSANAEGIFRPAGLSVPRI